MAVRPSTRPTTTIEWIRAFQGVAVLIAGQKVSVIVRYKGLLPPVSALHGPTVRSLWNIVTGGFRNSLMKLEEMKEEDWMVS
jgi:hypothetical protein